MALKVEGIVVKGSVQGKPASGPCSRTTAQRLHGLAGHSLPD